MLYTATLFVGANEMAPVNENEMLAATLILLATFFFNGLIFSDLVILVETLLQEDTQESRIFDEMWHLIDYMDMPTRTAMKIKAFITTNN